jgi:hypothetical protein
MSITFKKAGEAASKALAQQGGKAVAVASEAKIVLRPPRAVTAAEAPTIAPARESNKTTMMPWVGWFNRLLESSLGKERYTALRNRMVFAPEDMYDLEQAPRPAQKIPISKTDPTITHMYRYPSPGSQGSPKIPWYVQHSFN